jgi:hypothetical protein
MEVDYLILADAAAAENGKHYIHGGGWDQINSASFPVTHPHMAVALMLKAPWGDTNAPYEVAIDILDADGHSILPDRPLTFKINVGRPPQTPVGSDQVVALAFNIYSLKFEHAGDYTAVARIDNEDRKKASFRVVDIRTTGTVIST